MWAAWTEHKRFTLCCQELNLAWTWLAPAALLRRLSPLFADFVAELLCAFENYYQL
jgi:hypothetical protein